MRWSGIARERGRLFVLVCASVLFVGLVAGIGMALAADESPSPGESKVVLKLGWTNEPDNLNPFVGYEGSSYEVWALNYDMLIGYAAEDGSPEGRIAESWEVSDDGLTWTFKIREGVKWQDGTPLTASDVAFSYNVIIDNDLTAYSTYTKNIDHVRAIDDTTVEMVCSQPKANMERLWVYVLPEHIWGKLKNVEKYRMEYPIVGSGPFQCAEWKKGNYVKMVKNPGYWGPEPTIDEIYFQYYTNSDTMAQEVRSGVLDGAVDIPTAQFKTFGDLEGFDAVAYNIFLWEYLSFNCYSEPQSLGDPVLRDVKFRQALNWAVDKQKCVDIAWSGLAVPGTTVIPPDEFPADWDAHYEPTADETYGFDLDKARQLLDEAGYTDSDGDGVRESKGKPIKLRLWARSESLSSQNMGKLIAGWFSDIGLKIEFQVMDDGAISDKLYNYDADCAYAPDYDMYIWDFWGYADPGDTLSSFTTDQIEWWNDPCWSNAEFDRLAKEQYGEMDPAARLDMIHRMQQIMYVESPEIVVDYPSTLEVVNTDRWEGWTPFMDGGVFYTNYAIDSYLNLKPKAAEEAGGSSATTAIVVVVVIAVVIALVAWLLLHGRGGHAEEA
ncbi:MAG TPA: ABC transporter substrate-binding protein [Thermoleophilia bacterium]|nr:ABC transporter substrate-binding protein [Thermoleophilia bacterium]